MKILYINDCQQYKYYNASCLDSIPATCWHPVSLRQAGEIRRARIITPVDVKCGIPAWCPLEDKR